MRPYGRPVLHTNACVAMTFRHQRCGRRYFTEWPIAFEWDPVKGIGIGAPSATFCRMHDPINLRGPERMEVVGGWIGAAWNPRAKVWTVLTTVYETRDGLQVAKHWWSLRRPTRFGVTDSVTYDEASLAS